MSGSLLCIDILECLRQEGARSARIQLVKDKHKHKCVGVLMAPFHIKMLGVEDACRFCPAIGNNHTPACSVNQASAQRFKLRSQAKKGLMDKPWTRVEVARIEPDEVPRELEEGELEGEP